LFQCYEEPLWSERKAPCICNLGRCVVSYQLDAMTANSRGRIRR